MKKTKLEQIFLLIMFSFSAFLLLCISSCGGNSVECIGYGTACESKPDDSVTVTAAGVSIPGCGGCITPGKGCDSCLWPQAFKLAGGTITVEGETETESITIAGCDDRYYGEGCAGCGQAQSSTYTGIYFENVSQWGVFCGDTSSSGTAIGCEEGGCFGCTDGTHLGNYLINVMEAITGIYET